MQVKNAAVIAAIVMIWIAVIITSLSSPPFVSGAEASEFNVAAIVNWLWGGLATAFVLRSTVFNPQGSGGPDGKDAWVTLGLSVIAIWFAVIIVALASPVLTLTSPEVLTDGNPMEIPIGAIVAPIVGVGVTQYVCQFLVTGFYARAAGAATRQQI